MPKINIYVPQALHDSMQKWGDVEKIKASTVFQEAMWTEVYRIKNKHEREAMKRRHKNESNEAIHLVLGS